MVIVFDEVSSEWLHHFSSLPAMRHTPCPQAAFGVVRVLDLAIPTGVLGISHFKWHFPDDIYHRAACLSFVHLL
jgi:hypothetical protein